MRQCLAFTAAPQLLITPHAFTAANGQFLHNTATCMRSALLGVRPLHLALLAGLLLIMPQPTYGEVLWQLTKRQQGVGPPVPPPPPHPATIPHSPHPRHLLRTHRSNLSSSSRGGLSLREQSYRYGCSTCTLVGVTY